MNNYFHKSDISVVDEDKPPFFKIKLVGEQDLKNIIKSIIKPSRTVIQIIWLNKLIKPNHYDE